MPKPYGYFRIAIPDTAYTRFDWKGYPYSFRLSTNAYVDVHEKDGEMYWIDIQYPSLNATIHCSYKPVRNNLRTLSRDAQEFLYSHSTVASAIPAQEYANDGCSVYGLYFELYGNTATPIQFYLTDSVEHFFRASVYCNTIPNQDSLAPIHEYLRQDARMIMESMVWR
jgi:gliding motility-associated lipoprotein GldD